MVMNERILELINEATSFKEGLIEGKYDIEEFDKEKFAELIIRECTKLIEESTEDDEYWSRVTGAESIMAIEEHFGVEE
jgi:hypothetical protein